MKTDILLLITNVLKKHLWNDDYRFFLYWSRVMWNYSFRSDYDIWVLWNKPIKSIVKADILEDFEKIPALIDFTDFSKVSDDFKRISTKKIYYLN